MKILAERFIKVVVIWPIVLFIMVAAGCATKTEILPATL